MIVDSVKHKLNLNNINYKSFDSMESFKESFEVLQLVF